MRIFISRPLPDIAPQLLRAAGHEVTISSFDRPLTREELIAAAKAADGLLSFLTDKIDASFLAACPSLRAVANLAVGYDNIDIAACTARRIGVGNTPDVLTDATAEVAWMLLMMAARRATEAERSLRAGQWHGIAPLQYLGVDVVGKTLGIIGAGRIGARLARMAAGFNMPLLYHNRKPSPEMEALSAKLLSLDDLLTQSDFISIHVPLTPETRHLIGPAQFARMKPTAILVNTSRGPIVDEIALAHALKNHQFFAAGLDVYEKEPSVHPDLLTLPNVTLLPHIGSATHDTRAGMAKLAAENLVAMLAGKKPPAPVNPELWP